MYYIKSDTSSSVKRQTDRQTDYLSPVDQLPLSIVSFFENLQERIGLPKCVLNRRMTVSVI